MIKIKTILITFILLFIVACEKQQHSSTQETPISNNAVAIAYNSSSQPMIYSFNGLKADKTWQDVSSNSFAINPLNGAIKQLADVPGNAGRLASIAATVGNKVYIFGGYTVEADHSEVSTPEVYRFDPNQETYELVTQMPTPVDDSVALVYQDRYIYLVSGWHNDGNVSLVQILDTADMSWHLGTPYPGAPVFGHSAGILKNEMIISDGVKVLKVVDGKRHYGISDDNYLGSIDANDFRKINWQKLPMHPGPARYRMAAVASEKLGKAIFVGGSDNPYNFNGIGYNGIASEPVDLIFAYDFTTEKWQTLGAQKKPTMDHRGLLEIEQNFYIFGGMESDQKTTAKLYKIELDVSK